MKGSTKLKIAIVGGGKMGNATKASASELGFDVVSVAREAVDCLRWLKNGLQVHCVVDFSHTALTEKAVEFCKIQKIPLVTGTTGLSGRTQNMIKDLSATVAVCQSANFSVGMAVLKRMVRQAVGDLVEFGFDCELTEKHHATKKDSPSGTAKDILAEMQKGLTAGEKIGLVDLKDWQNGGRIRLNTATSVGVHSYRCGEVVGKHTIEFFGTGEELALLHVAQDKKVFAKGALEVATKIVTEKAGLYPFEYFVFKKSIGG